MKNKPDIFLGLCGTGFKTAFIGVKQLLHLKHSIKLVICNHKPVDAKLIVCKCLL